MAEPPPSAAALGGLFGEYTPCRAGKPSMRNTAAVCAAMPRKGKAEAHPQGVLAKAIEASVVIAASRLDQRGRMSSPLTYLCTKLEASVG